MAKQKKKWTGIVYSTDENFEFSEGSEQILETLPPEQQKLYILRDTKNRKGKEATLIEGFVGQKSDLNDLAKLLKTKCGVGGNVIEDVILIQGDKRTKVKEILEDLGYRCILKGG